MTTIELFPVSSAYGDDQRIECHREALERARNTLRERGTIAREANQR